MPTPITLPKVANYIKNVGKSVNLASIDYLKNIAPNTSDFLETNEDLFKEITSTVVNYRDSVKKANASFKKSKVYEAYEVGKKALFEDLKTGKWYNAEREAALGMKALDMDMDDMEFDDSLFSFEDTDTSDAARQSRAFDASISASTKVQANVIARSADLVSNTVKASTSALFAQNERMIASMTSGMGSLHAAVSGVNQYLQGPMMTALQNTKVFQEQSMEHYKKVEAQMDELLQMQRNLYGVTSQELKTSDYGKVVDYSGIPDLREYGRVIKKNFKDLIGPEAEMLFGNTFGKNSNMLLTLVSSPLKAIPELLVKTIVPLTVKKAVEQFDQSISGVFTTMVAQLGGLKDSENPILSALGRLFGIRVDMKSKVDTDKYKKGPVPFDGVTRQTIVEVIPGHLRRIEAALTGQTERIYDLKNGKWTNVRAVEKDYKDRQQSAMTMAFSDLTKELNGFIEDLKKTNEKQAEEYAQALEDIKLKVFEDRGNFLGYKSKGDDKPWDYYGVDRDVYMTMMRYFLGNPKPGQKKNYSRLMNLSREVNNQIEAWNQFMEDAANGNNPVLQLFNGAYNVDTTFGVKYDPNKSRSGIKYTNVLVDAVDENNRNIFFYLRGIYNMMGGKDTRGGTTSTGPTSGGTGGGGIYVPGYIRRRSGVTGSTSQQDRIAYEDSTENFILNDAMREKYGDGTQQTTFVGEAKKRFRDASLGEKWKMAQENINLILKKPGEALTNIINTADKRLFELMFGKEEAADAEKKFGKKPGGLLEYMLIRMEETFNKMDDWLHENVFNKIKTWLDNEFGFTDKLNKAKDWVKDKIHWEDIKNNVRGKWRSTKSQVGGAFRAVGSDIYNSGVGQQVLLTTRLMGSGVQPFTGSNYQDIRGSNRGAIGGNAGNITPEAWQEFKDLVAKFRSEGMTYNQAEKAARDQLGYAASGRFVTKRGLVVVSPGETIIPATFSKSGQARQLAKEKSYARRFGFKNVGYYATGTVDSPTGAAETIPGEAAAKEKEKVTDTIKKVAKEVNMSGDYADLAVNSLIGAGVSLITGMIGGPLLGAALGAGVSILKQSETAKTIFFGKMGEDGEREGGLISANLQKNFKKYFPDMKNYGIVGAVAGLITPLGLIGGLMTGGAIGFLKNNDKFQEFMFGKIGEDGERDGGLINKELRKKLTKAAPRMLVGAAGGALLGPFGLLGNVVMGSAIGYATTTQKFHDIIFGYDDENGKHRDGMLDALKKGFINPMLEWGKALRDEFKEFFQKRVLEPLKNFINPFMQMIKNGITGFFDFLKEKSVNALDKYIGRPLADFFQHTIFDNVAKWTKRFLRVPISLAKGVIGAPFQLLGAIGNNIRTSQIAKGTAGDMTAQERLNWRDKHRGRMFGKEILGHDRFKELDQKLADMRGREGIERMKQLRDQLKIYDNTRKELGNQIADLVERAGRIISDFFNDTPYAQDPSIMSYVALKSGKVKKVHEAVRDGDMKKVEKLVNGFVKDGYIEAEDAVKLLNDLSPLVERIAEGRENQKNASEYRKKLQGDLGKINPTLRNAKNIRRFRRLLDKEIASREAEEAAKSPESKVVEGMSDLVDERTKRMLDLMESGNEYLKMLTMTPEQRKAYKKRKKSEAAAAAGTGAVVNDTEKTAEDEGDVTALDDLIAGTAKKAVDRINKGYHTIETPDGAQGLADSNGNVLSTNSASKVKKYLQQAGEEKTEAKTFRERLNDSLFGKAVGKVTDILGGAKSGLFGLLGSFFDKFSGVFNILKWVFIGGTAIAATGHASGWLKDSVFPWLKEHVAPWLIGTRNEDGVLQGGIRGAIFGNKNQFGEYEGGILSGAANWFQTTPIYKFFSNLHQLWEEGGGITGLVEPIIDWYADGTGKFMQNIVTPIISLFIQNLPDLAVAVGKGVVDGLKKFFGFGNNVEFDKDEEGNATVTNTTTGQKASIIEDEQGNLSYVYSDGTVETDPNATFTINRSGNYSRYEDRSAVSLVGQGLATNFIHGVTGLGSQAAGTTIKFGPKLTKVRNFLNKIPIVKTLNKAVGGATKLFNAASKGGTVARNAGGKVREYLMKQIGKTNQATGTVAGAVDDTINAAAGAADDVAGAAANTAGSVVDDVAGVAAGAADDAAGAAAKGGSFFSKAGNWVKNKVSNAATAVGNATGTTGLLSKIKNGIISFFTKIGENGVVKKLISGIAKILGTSIDDILLEKGMKTVGEQLAKKVGENVAVSALKSIGSVLASIPIFTIVMAVGYFVSGWNDAHTIFGIVDDIEIPVCYNLIAGLVNAVKNCLPGIGIILSFIPTSAIIDLFVDVLFPIFKWDTSSLKKMREESQRYIDELNATLPEDERVTSVDEYNDRDSIWNRIKETASNIGSGIANFFTGGSRDEEIKVESLNDQLKDQINENKRTRAVTESFRGNRGSSRKSGKGHVYQKATELANKRFGNSTVGEAGCGPVAATNLINKMGGNIDIDTALNYAENGSFIDPATGGTTTNYISSMLRNSGIPSYETYSKSSVMDSLRNGNPVVMLGNSGSEVGTPFGANDHYITAMGLDNQGNIIAEDPDLPDSYRKYKASRVMNDMELGIATGGMGRKIAGFRAGLSRRGAHIKVARAKARSRFNAKKFKKNARGRKSGGTGSTYSIADWTFRCADCIAQVESGGSYTAVAANDKGTMSLGRYQFRGSRCQDLMRKIINALTANGVYTVSDIANMLGQRLFAYFDIADSDATFVPGENQIAAMQTLLGSDEGIIQQDIKMTTDCQGYYDNYLKGYGLVLPDQEDIVIYLSSAIHNYGNGGSKSPVNEAIKKAKSNTGKAANKLTLDDIHTAMISTNYGSERADSRFNKHYAYLKNSQPLGTGNTKCDELGVSETMLQVAQNSAEEIAGAEGNYMNYSGSSTSNADNLLTQLGQVITDVMTYIYGDSLMSIFGDTSGNSVGLINGGSTGGSLGNVIYGNVGKASNGQQALVNWMKSVEGQLAYSCEDPYQDPDRGVASCASTVGWAYRKALGVTGMSAGANTQMRNLPNYGAGFGYVYNREQNGAFNVNNADQVLQPGDVLYYKTPGGVEKGLKYGVGHVEMYMGDGKRIGHGGGSSGTEKGPTVKNMLNMGNYESNNLMVAGRYLPFINGEQPEFYNPDGSKGTYGTTVTATKANVNTGNMFTNVAIAKSRSGKSRSGKGGLVSGGRRKFDSASHMRKMRKANNKALESQQLLQNYNDALHAGEYGANDIDLTPSAINDVSSATSSGTVRSRSGRALSSAVSYEDFLNVIIELLTIIAKNSDNLTAILNLLSKTYNTTINPSDVTAASDSKSAQSRLRHALRHSGLGRAASGTSGGGEGANGYGGINERSQNDIQYVIGLMESLAKA